MIERAEHRYPGEEGVALAFRATLLSCKLAEVEPPPEPTRTVGRRTAKTEAYVNHGRWVADCAFCPSAQIVSPEDPRFFCADCRNLAVGGAYVPVVFPAELDAIEAPLLLRPDRRVRNWLPREDVVGLWAENEAMMPPTGDPGELVVIRGRPRPQPGIS